MKNKSMGFFSDLHSIRLLMKSQMVLLILNASLQLEDKRQKLKSITYMYTNTHKYLP